MNSFPEWFYTIAKFEEDKDNPSAAPKLIKLDPIAPCDACGKDLDKTRIVQIRYCQKPTTYIQKKCQTCGLYEHPFRPNEFILPNSLLREVLSNPELDVDTIINDFKSDLDK